MQFSSNADLVTHLEKQLNEVCFGSPEDAKEAVDRHFSPDYVQVTDGNTLGYEEFVEHIRHLRGKIVGGTVEVQEAVQNGNLIADRHTMTATKVGGGQLVGEVYAFTHIDSDGRIVRVNEISHLIIADESDRDLPHAR